LSINLNNLITNINWDPTSADSQDTTKYANGAIIQNGTQIQIYNESNSIVQLTSRNFYYTESGIDYRDQLSQTDPVPAFPYNRYEIPLNPLAKNVSAIPPSPYETPPPGWPDQLGHTYTAPDLNTSRHPNPTINPINLRDTTSDVIYIKQNDSIKLIYTINKDQTSGSWGYI
jgi:uncharacterized protein YcfL